MTDESGLAPRSQLYDKMVFACFLLIGADKLSLSIGGMFVRLLAVPLILATLLFTAARRRPTALDANIFLFMGLYFVASIISIYGSYDINRSIGYTVWAAFTVLFVFQVFYNYAISTPIEVVSRVWFTVFRWHAIAAIIASLIYHVTGRDFIREDLISYFGRSFLWFHEASLLGFFLSGYFCASLYLAANERRSYWRDVMLGVLSLGATASASQALGMAIGVLIVAMLSRRRKTIVIAAALTGLTAWAAIQVFGSDLQENPVYHTTIGYVLDAEDWDSFFRLMTWRTGLRAPGMVMAWDAFLSHPITGIGVGADHTYTRMVPLTDEAVRVMGPWWWSSSYDERWKDGILFCNLFIEVAGTTGLLGLVPYALGIGYVVLSIRRVAEGGRDGRLLRAFYLAIIVMIAVLQIDGGGTLRFYLWNVIGLALGATAQLERARLPSVSGGDVRPPPTVPNHAPHL